MTVTELCQELQALIESGQGHRIVVLSRDPEGNGFHELRDVALSRYHTVEREIGIDALTPELKQRGWTQENVMEGPAVVPSVTLWP